MKKIIVLLCLVAGVANAQPGLGITIDTNSLKGTGSSANPLGLRTTCSSNQTLVWSGTAWGCGTTGTVSGTIDTMAKFTGTTAVGNSLWTDDGITTNYNISALTLTVGGVATTNRLVLNGASSGNSLNITASTGWWGVRSDTTDSTALMGRRALTANTLDDTAAVQGQTTGTMAVAAGDVYNYGVRGISTVTNSTAGGALHSWGVFGRCGVKDVTATLSECIGVNGSAGTGSLYGVGGSFRAGGGTGSATVIGAFGQADTTGTGSTFGVFGYGRTGAARVGVSGQALSTGPGATSNIGVWARYGAYSETPPTFSGALYADGISQFSDDATFESGTCVINSAGITCGGTLITPGADITAVTAGNGLTGGGTSGAVTLDVAVGTGLSVAADQVNLNLAGASCSAGNFVSAISSTGTGTCTAAAGGITNSAGNNVITKSNGTNLVASSLTDSGTEVAAADARITATVSTAAVATAVTASMGRTAATSTLYGLFARNNSSLNTTAGALTSYAVYGLNLASRSAGANNLTNIGVYGDATTGQVNYSGYFDNGSFHVGGAADFSSTLALTGNFTVNTNKLIVTASSGDATFAGTVNAANFTASSGIVTSLKDKTTTWYGKSGSTPSLSACGSSPTLTTGSTNLAGEIIVGTTAGTSCTITWSTTWEARPMCIWATSGGAIYPTETTTSATVTGAKVSDGATIRYVCVGTGA